MSRTAVPAARRSSRKSGPRNVNCCAISAAPSASVFPDCSASSTAARLARRLRSRPPACQYVAIAHRASSRARRPAGTSARLRARSSSATSLWSAATSATVSPAASALAASVILSPARAASAAAASKHARASSTCPASSKLRPSRTCRPVSSWPRGVSAITIRHHAATSSQASRRSAASAVERAVSAATSSLTSGRAWTAW